MRKIKTKHLKLKMSFRFFYIIFLILFIQCASNPVSDTLSDWKKEQNDRYWYGVAIIDKKTTSNFQESARNQAISDIASQIKIKISQDFKRVVKENNYKIKDYSVQILESQIDNNLEEVEIINFEDLGDTYMLYARLSKDKYYSKIQSKRENAKNLALEYIAKVSSPSSESFRYLAKAESEISQYIDSPIFVRHDNKKQNLYTVIQSLKNSILSKISIEPNEYEKSIKSLIPDRDFITFKVINSDSKEPISNIPLFSEINEGVNHCSTNNKGECNFYIDRTFINKDLVQYMHVGVDQVQLYDNEYVDNYYDKTININLVPMKVYLDVEEYNLGNEILHPYIKPVIKEFLIKELNLEFSNTISECDLFVYVNATTNANKKKSNEYGIYQVFGNATIDVKFVNKQESILNLAINDVQGVSFNSLEQAGNKSLENISDKIFNETLIELVSILKQN